MTKLWREVGKNNLTILDSYDTILIDDRWTIFSLVNLAQSRFRKLNRLLSSTEMRLLFRGKKWDVLKLPVSTKIIFVLLGGV